MSAEAALVEIDRFVKTFKAFSEVQNSLQALVGLEQNVKELSQLRDSLKDEVNGLTLSKDSLIELTDKLNEIYKNKQDELEASITLWSNGLTAQVYKDVADLQASLTESISVQKKTYSTLQNKSDSISSQIVIQQQTLDDLNSKIVAAQLSIQKLLGN